MREFPSAEDALQRIISIASSETVFNYDELITSFQPIPLSDAEIQTLLLALDPNDAGTLRAYTIEHEVFVKKIRHIFISPSQRT